MKSCRMSSTLTEYCSTKPGRLQVRVFTSPTASCVRQLSFHAPERGGREPLAIGNALRGFQPQTFPGHPPCEFLETGAQDRSLRRGAHADGISLIMGGDLQLLALINEIAGQKGIRRVTLNNRFRIIREHPGLEPHNHPLSALAESQKVDP